MDHLPVKGTITVSATGTVTVQPDTARLRLGAMATHESSTEAYTQVATDISTLVGALKESGILDKDIKTANVNVRLIAEHDRDGNYIGVSGYEVSSSLNVIVRDLELVGRMLDIAVRHGANTVDGTEFYVDDPGPAAGEARALAVRQARVSADRLGSAAGMTVTGVFAIMETSSPSSTGARQFNGSSARMLYSVADSSMPISAGETDISVQIEAIYEVAPLAT